MADIDSLVERAVSVVSRMARRGSTLTTGVAIVAAIVVGAAYLVGLAAFDGGTRTAWAVIGGALLVIAVGAPLVATFRLRSIPRRARLLAGELRTLLDRDESARRVVVDTVAAEDRQAVPGASGTAGPRGGLVGGGLVGGGFGGSRTPEVVIQFQRFSELRSFARSDDVRNIATIARTIGTLPALVAAGILLTGVGAVLGFIFTLIWIF